MLGPFWVGSVGGGGREARRCAGGGEVRRRLQLPEPQQALLDGPALQHAAPGVGVAATSGHRQAPPPTARAAPPHLAGEGQREEQNHGRHGVEHQLHPEGDPAVATARRRRLLQVLPRHLADSVRQALARAAVGRRRARRHRARLLLLLPMLLLLLLPLLLGVAAATLLQ